MRTSGSVDRYRYRGAILEGLEQYEKPVGSTELPALMFRKGSTQSKATLGGQNLLEMFNTEGRTISWKERSIEVLVKLC